MGVLMWVRWWGCDDRKGEEAEVFGKIGVE